MTTYTLGNSVVNNSATTSNLNNGSFDDIQLPSIKRQCLRTDQYGFIEGITNAVGVLHNDNADTIAFSQITAADLNLSLTGDRAVVSNAGGTTIASSTVTTAILEGLDARVTTNTTNIATNTTNISTINNTTIPNILNGTTEFSKLNFLESGSAENVYFEPYFNGGTGTVGLAITNSVTDGSLDVSLDIFANTDQHSYLNFYQGGTLNAFIYNNGSNLSFLSEGGISFATATGTGAYITNFALDNTYTRIINPEATGSKLLYYNSSTKLLTEGTSNTAPSFSSITDTGLTASTALYSNASKVITSSATSSTELGYVSGVTSAIQTQINSTNTNVTTNTSNIATNAANIATNTASITTITGTTIPNILNGTTSFTTATMQGVTGNHGTVAFNDDTATKKGHLRLNAAGSEMELGCTAGTTFKIDSSAQNLIIQNSHTTDADAITSLKNSNIGYGLTITNTGNAFVGPASFGSTLGVTGATTLSSTLAAGNTSITGTMSTTSTATIGNLTASRAIYGGTGGLLTSCATTSNSDLNYIAGMTGNAQTQISANATNITTITGTTIPNILNGTTTFTGIKTNLTANKIAYIDSNSKVASQPSLMYYAYGYNYSATTALTSAASQIRLIRLLDLIGTTNTGTPGPYLLESYDTGFYTPNANANKYSFYTIKTSGQKFKFNAYFTFYTNTSGTSLLLYAAYNATAASASTAITTVFSGGATCVGSSTIAVHNSSFSYTCQIAGFLTTAATTDTLSFWFNVSSGNVILMAYSVQIEHCL